MEITREIHVVGCVNEDGSEELLGAYTTREEGVEAMKASLAKTMDEDFGDVLEMAGYESGKQLVEELGKIANGSMDIGEDDDKITVGLRANQAFVDYHVTFYVDCCNLHENVEEVGTEEG